MQKEIDHEEVIDKLRGFLEKKGLSIQDMYFLVKRMEEELLGEIMGDEEEPEEEPDEELEEGDESDEEPEPEEEKPKITAKKPKVKSKKGSEEDATT